MSERQKFCRRHQFSTQFRPTVAPDLICPHIIEFLKSSDAEIAADRGRTRHLCEIVNTFDYFCEACCDLADKDAGTVRAHLLGHLAHAIRYQSPEQQLAEKMPALNQQIQTSAAQIVTALNAVAAAIDRNRGKY